MENNSNLIKCPDLDKNNIPNKIDNLADNQNKNAKQISENFKRKEETKADANKQAQKNNLDKIKEYLNKNEEEQNYSKIINENPDSLFKNMNEQRLITWESILYIKSTPLRKHSDSEMLYTPLDRFDQKVIKNDSIRTRVRERVLIPGYSKILESALTYYCNSKNIYYKQGLNEIFGVLILLQYKFKNIKLSKLFDLAEVLIDQYLPNYFYEKEIYSLQSSLSLFVILLKYHEPSVYNRFDTTETLPQMYATNSIITLMSGKLKINIVYELWERIIKSQDPLMMHFILVAHFITHRELIINCEKILLAPLINALGINTVEELDNIMDLAFKLRERTPYSYRILANKLGFLKTNNKYIKEAYEIYKPQSIPAMPIFPIEVLSITYKFTEECVDPDCKNYVLYKNNNNNKNMKKNSIFDLNDELDEMEIDDGFLKFEKNINSHICEKCDMKIEKKIQNILLDLRILNYGEEDDDTEKTGFLPMMINVDQEELKSEDFNKIITNRFLGERGNYHFIFLTSSTENFTEFENKYYTDNLSELDKKKMMFGLIKQRKVDKKLNLENAQKDLTWKEIYKLKEYDNFRNVLKTNQKQNFPYVGFVFGGFNEVHDISIKYGYDLLFHNEDNCIICLNKKGDAKLVKKEKEMEEKIKNEISDSLWEHKTKIKYNKINEIYHGKKINTFLCILTKYKNKVYNKQKEQVLIIVSLDEFFIEFFKFDTKKEYRETKVETNAKEKKKKISEYYDLGKEEEDMDNETELSLFAKIFIYEVKSLNIEKKSKNIVHCTIVENKDKKKQDMNNYEIILDFSSINDSKTFFKCFKNAVKDFKNKNQ